MGELASPGQLRMSFLRVALVTVPLLLFLGILASVLSGADAGNAWFAALAKPALMPSAWLFPLVWMLLYVLIGFALAMILCARGAAVRGIAIGLFVAMVLLNLAWFPVFFVLHGLMAAFGILLLAIVLGVATVLAFARIRPRAAALVLPYLAWLCFVGWLDHAIGALNPGAETLAPAHPSAQVQL